MACCSRRTFATRSSADPAAPARHGSLRELVAGPTLDAARGLIGAHLVREAAHEPGPAGASERRVARIVEVEAYIGEDDRASHARFGRTSRNTVMFGPPGVAYVYLVYGMYECLNVVTEADGRAAAVLIRAVEPLEGVAAMRAARIRHALRRARTDDAPERAITRLERLPGARLAAGPGLVAAAFDIDRTSTGADLLDPAAVLRLEAGDAPARIATTPRIGIGYAAEPFRSLPWRFLDPDSQAVSTRSGTSLRPTRSAG
ncbi:MAG TPA: DNA-3-methyladenine glycosylase [Candidatus Limnocylindria bacterium]|nr:DNA-3-methyladenine glycosylase [Candidatus Limnocylindria bacterium]